MKLWIDDIRRAPAGYIWIKSVNEAKALIEYWESPKGNVNVNMFPNEQNRIDLISIDHDAGDYAKFGGDYIKLLDWFEETDRSYPIHIHSMNSVGVENMRRIIQRNNWKEVR